MEDTPAAVGKVVGGALYVHRSSLSAIRSDHAELVHKAMRFCFIADWNVAKLDIKSGRSVSLLVYEDFASSAFPALLQSCRVDLETGAVTVRRYGSNPPILHRKELLLPSDDPRRTAFAALTQELESKGLFTDMARRGRKNAWEAALASAEIEVRDHRVMAPKYAADERPSLASNDVPPSETMSAIARHRTAIGRNSLSAPMAAVNAAGLLDDDVRVLDYGCGRGDDVRALRSAGIDAIGWDPHFAPDESVLSPRDVVNLGFVLNVVEDPDERRTVLRRAFDLTERCLVVAVMLVGKGDVSGHRPHGDGFLTSRGTFQRYYTQAELREFLFDTLRVTPVAAGPGIFFLFRDEELEQQVLSRRQMGMATRLIPAVQRPIPIPAHKMSGRQEALSGVRGDLVGLLLSLGRIPHSDELPKDVRERLSSARLSIKTALTDALSDTSAEDLAATAGRRADEIGRFFALGAFLGRAPYRRLSQRLQRDVRAFFGSQEKAQAVGRRMLFEAGDAEGLFNDAETHAASGLGYLIGDKFEVHSRDVARLSPRMRTYIGIAETIAGSLGDTTIYRIHLLSKKLTALVYPEFDAHALPRLAKRTKIELQTGEVFVFDHQDQGRVSVLMEKSLYMKIDEERYEAQANFDAKVRDIFGDRLRTLPFAEVASEMIRVGLRLPY